MVQVQKEFNMAHKIAIIKTTDTYSNYGDDSNTIINSITDWTEVSHDDFCILKKTQYDGQFYILEQPTDTVEFVAKTVAEYLEKARKDEAAAIIAKKKKDAANLARKHAKGLKDRESKLALLKKLQEELSEDQ
jgi:hypothetical protein